MKILNLIIVSVVTFCGCTTVNEDIRITELKKSAVSSYIDYNSDFEFISSDCLNQFSTALNGIIWDTNKLSIEFGLTFTPLKFKNKYYHKDFEERFILLKTREVKNNDTNNLYEIYYLNSYFESLKPCYLIDENTLLVDTVIDITPNKKYLQNNCLMVFNNWDYVPGVFELYSPDSVDIDWIDSVRLLPRQP